MPHPRFVALLLSISALAVARAHAAQWTSTPYNSTKPITATDWYVAHDAGNGFRVCSAIAQQWTPLANAGATLRHSGGMVLAVQQGNSIHAWSALSNTAAAQPMVGLITSQFNSATSFCLFRDLVPGTPAGVIWAFSAYTSAWTSFTPPAAWTLEYGTNVALVQTAGQLHGYSPYTGQWTTLDASGSTPYCGTEYATANLVAQSRYAAFSPLRGTWSLSPPYPSAGSGAGLINSPTATVFAIRTEIGSATQHSYSAYSPFTGQWATSPLVHPNVSSKQTAALGHGVRIMDSDTSARFDYFAGGTGEWHTLTGPNLTEDNGHREDFHIVRTLSGSPATVWAASALVGGGYQSISVPTSLPTISLGRRGCVVYGGASPATASAWAYSAGANAFAAPIPYSQVSAPPLAGFGAVFGFNLEGPGSDGSLAQAYSVLAHEWTAGPAIDAAHTWSTTGSDNEVTLIREDGAAGNAYHAFDAHARAWKPAPGNTTHYSVGMNSFLAYSPANGTYHGFSAERGDWTTQTGIGTIVLVPAAPQQREHLAYIADSNQKLWMFATPDRAYSWFRWPYARQFGRSGTAGGGNTPYVGVSVRGAASTELALVYGALALAPTPLALPGFGGLLDLDPLGAFQLANLGVFDADGVREARIPVASPLAAGTQAWMQPIVVDLVSLQASFAGRATGARFF